jgi:hypothetical protein
MLFLSRKPKKKHVALFGLIGFNPSPLGCQSMDIEGWAMSVMNRKRVPMIPIQGFQLVEKTILTGQLMGTCWIDGLQLRMTHREIRMTILNDLQFSISGEILEVTTFGKMLGYVDMYLDDGISW